MLKAARLVVPLALAATVLAGCGSGDPLAEKGSDGSSAGSLVIGSADFTESQLVATIYSVALEDAGVDVTERFSVGSREVTVPALQDGSLDLMPEYSGAFLAYYDNKAQASDPDQVVQQLSAKLPQGLTLLDHAPAEDGDVLAVSKQTAERYHLKTVSDLAPVAGELALGGPAEWQTRYNGVLGLKQLYGLDFGSFVTLDAGGPLSVDALANGQVQVADLFSTDPAMHEKGFVALEDDKGLFLAENVVPVANEKKVNGTVRDTLNRISAALTTEDLITLNGEAATGTDLHELARTWLKDKGLLAS